MKLIFFSGSPKKRKKTKTTYVQNKLRKLFKVSSFYLIVFFSKCYYQQKSHIRFDEDGNPITVEESSVLPKVKHFLKATSKENIVQGLISFLFQFCLSFTNIYVLLSGLRSR